MPPPASSLPGTGRPSASLGVWQFPHAITAVTRYRPRSSAGVARWRNRHTWRARREARPSEPNRSPRSLRDAAGSRAECLVRLAHAFSSRWIQMCTAPRPATPSPEARSFASDTRGVVVACQEPSNAEPPTSRSRSAPSNTVIGWTCRYAGTASSRRLASVNVGNEHATHGVRGVARIACRVHALPATRAAHFLRVRNLRGTYWLAWRLGRVGEPICGPACGACVALDAVVPSVDCAPSHVGRVCIAIAGAERARAGGAASTSFRCVALVSVASMPPPSPPNNPARERPRTRLLKERTPGAIES